MANNNNNELKTFSEYLIDDASGWFNRIFKRFWRFTMKTLCFACPSDNSDNNSSSGGGGGGGSGSGGGGGNISICCLGDCNSCGDLGETLFVILAIILLLIALIILSWLFAAYLMLAIAAGAFVISQCLRALGQLLSADFKTSLYGVFLIAAFAWAGYEIYKHIAYALSTQLMAWVSGTYVSLSAASRHICAIAFATLASVTLIAGAIAIIRLIVNIKHTDTKRKSNKGKKSGSVDSKTTIAALISLACAVALSVTIYEEIMPSAFSGIAPSPLICTFIIGSVILWGCHHLVTYIMKTFSNRPHRDDLNIDQRQPGAFADASSLQKGKNQQQHTQNTDNAPSAPPEQETQQDCNVIVNNPHNQTEKNTGDAPPAYNPEAALITLY